jgi:hypothetical protein
MFISSHENEHSFSNEAHIPMTSSLYETTTPQYEECSGLHSGTKPLLSQPPHFSEHLTIVNFCIFSATYHFCLLHIFLGTMMMIDHDKFLPTIVMMSHTPYHVNIRKQYDSTHHNDNAQHVAWYNSTKRTTLPLPGKSQRTHLYTANVHNNRPMDSAHFA